MGPLSATTIQQALQVKSREYFKPSCMKWCNAYLSLTVLCYLTHSYTPHQQSWGWIYWFYFVRPFIWWTNHVHSIILLPMEGSFSGWETRHSPKLGSVLYSLYKIPLAQACFPLARPNLHSHWRAGECLFPSLLFVQIFNTKESVSCVLTFDLVTDIHH